MRAIDDVACSKPGCDNFGQPGVNIVCHGLFTTKSGRRRRYRCKSCGATFNTNTGTAYRGLRCGRRAFDQVASLRVEGVSLSATARVTGHSRNTIARWLERASMAAKRFNQQMLKDFPILELRADELFTFVASKRRTIWLFAIIEVSSRLWAGSRLGRRSYRHAKAVLNDVILRGRLVGVPLIATDGFEYYCGAILRLVGPACIYGQVIKTRRNNRVIRVERRLKIGTAGRLNEALLESEDSETLNTSFIERLNLTIRQGSAYLRHWFAKRPRFHVHFTPTYASWVSLVERWFALLTTKQIRRGAFRSVPQLKAAIQAFIDAHQENPKPFIWTKTADEILASIARFAERTADARAIQLLSRTIGTGH